MARGRRISTKRTLGTFVAGLLILGCAPPEPLPNILFILVDTLRADVLEGNAPRLEKLGYEGAVFDRVIAPSSWTKTSMASIVTSRTPLRHGVRSIEDALPDELVTLAEGLAAAGYTTLGVNANPWLTHVFQFDEGFHRYKSKRLADATTLNAAALRMLERIPERPAFLYLHYMDTHAPYRPDPGSFQAPPLRIRGRGLLSDVEIEFEYRKSGLRSPEAIERVRALYEAEVRGLDAAIGELLEALEARGFLDDALIVVTSDHGEAFLEHGTTVHGKNFYPEVYRVPLILKWTGRVSPGLRIGSQVRSMDIAPTIFGFLGLDPPASFEGRSMLPLDPENMRDQITLGAVGLNDYIPHKDYVGVVSRDFLYLRERRADEVEFYDLRADPGALNELGAHHPEAARHAAYLEDASFHAVDSEALNSSHAQKVKIDAETRRQLEGLGYLPRDE